MKRGLILKWRSLSTGLPRRSCVASCFFEAFCIPTVAMPRSLQVPLSPYLTVSLSEMPGMEGMRYEVWEWEGECVSVGRQQPFPLTGSGAAPTLSSEQPVARLQHVAVSFALWMLSWMFWLGQYVILHHLMKMFSLSAKNMHIWHQQQTYAANLLSESVQCFSTPVLL